MRSQSFGTYGRRGAVTCAEEVSTRVNAFVMRYVSVQKRDVQSDKNDVVG